MGIRTFPFGRVFLEPLPVAEVECEEEGEEGRDEQVPDVLDSGEPECTAHIFVHDQMMMISDDLAAIYKRGTHKGLLTVSLSKEVWKVVVGHHAGCSGWHMNSSFVAQWGLGKNPFLRSLTGLAWLLRKS